MPNYKSLQKLLIAYKEYPGHELVDLKPLLDKLRVAKTKDLSPVDRDNFFWSVSEMLFDIRRKE